MRHRVAEQVGAQLALYAVMCVCVCVLKRLAGSTRSQPARGCLPRRVRVGAHVVSCHRRRGPRPPGGCTWARRAAATAAGAADAFAAAANASAAASGIIADGWSGGVCGCGFLGGEEGAVSALLVEGCCAFHFHARRPSATRPSACSRPGIKTNKTKTTACGRHHQQQHACCPHPTLFEAPVVQFS